MLANYLRICKGQSAGLLSVVKLGLMKWVGFWLSSCHRIAGLLLFLSRIFFAVVSRTMRLCYLQTALSCYSSLPAKLYKINWCYLCQLTILSNAVLFHAA